MRALLLGPFLKWAGRLSHPRLFAVIGALFFFDLLVPDLIPFIDEILLGLGTLVLANLKRKSTSAPSTGNVIDGEAHKR